VRSARHSSPVNTGNHLLSRVAIPLAILLCFLNVVPLGAEQLLLEEILIKGQETSPSGEILTITEVRESPARDIGEALKQIDGIDIVRKGAIANDVVLRGFQRDNLNVLVDGVRLYGGCPNRMDSPAFHFDFAEVEQISIIKGPYDLSNPGSMAGLIDVQTRSAAPGPHADVNLTYGSWDMINASGTASYGGDRADGLLGYAYKYSDPPKSGDGKRITEIYPVGSPNAYRPKEVDSRAYEINTVWFKGGYAPAGGGKLDLSYSYQDADHVLYPYLLMDADYDRTHRVNLTYTQENLTPLLNQLKVQAYWNQVEHLMDDSLRNSSLPTMMITRDYSMETDAYSRVMGAKLQTGWNLGGGELRTGLDYYDRTWNATNRLAAYMYNTQPMIPDVQTDNVGAFAEYSHPLAEKLTLKGGVRGDWTDSEARSLSAERLALLYRPYWGSDAKDNSDFFALSGNMQLTWTPQQEWELFFGLGSGVRAPDPQELFMGLQRPMNSNWVGNPGLDPTRSNQADVGVKYATDRYYVHGSLFYSRLDDYITVVDLPSPSATLLKARSFANAKAEMWGGELGSQVSLPADLYLLLSLSYTEGENRDTDEPLAEIPPLQGTLGLRYDVGSWFLELSEQFADRQDRVDETLSESETAGWAVTDLKGGVILGDWSVYAGLNNLFDKEYYSHLSYQRDPFRSGYSVPENGRNAYVTVNYRY